MNIWVFMGRYEGDLFASTHLTEKGAVLAALYDILEYMGIASEEDARSNPEDAAAQLPWDYDELKTFPTTQLWEVYAGYREHLWDDYSYEIDIHQTQVTG
jgi:hypothetical protein